MSVHLDSKLREELRQAVSTRRRERAFREDRLVLGTATGTVVDEDFLDEFPVPLPSLPLSACSHRGLRAPRLADWEDLGNFPSELRCPDCRMILDGPA